MMNKPAGFVCSAVSDSHHTVYELLPPHLQLLVQNPKRGNRLHTIGRLDCETSGLLLFTTDGHFSHMLTEPKNGIKKTYIVGLKTPGALDYITKAQSKLLLPAEKKAPAQESAPAEVCPSCPSYSSFLSSHSRSVPPIQMPFSTKVCPSCHSCPTPCSLQTWQITVTEGKFHEVRRIFKALGNEVIKLKRISMGPYTLPKNLEEGKYIEFTPSETEF